MKLPNAEQATVPEEKTTGYLLSAEHEHGRAKHGFFTRFGFTVDEWDVLRSALLRHAAEHEVATVTEMRGGTAYAVDGPLAAPDGRTPLVRTVWFIDVGGHESPIHHSLSAETEDEMMRELDIVALTVDLPNEHLKAGDTGTIVLECQGGTSSSSWMMREILPRWWMSSLRRSVWSLPTSRLVVSPAPSRRAIRQSIRRNAPSTISPFKPPAGGLARTGPGSRDGRCARRCARRGNGWWRTIPANGGSMAGPGARTRPFRVYVDTSVLGGCLDPEFAGDSRRVIDAARLGWLVLLISALLADELEPAPEPVQAILAALPATAMEFVPITPEVIALRDEHLTAGIVNEPVA